MSSFTKRAAVTLAVLLALAGCGYDETPLPKEPEEETTSSSTQADCENTTETYESYAPSDEVGPKVQEILDRGRLIVGVSADTYLMGSENPAKGNVIEGFDIEFVRAIGRAIFGAGFQPGRQLELRVISAADRIDLLVDREVDLVVRNFTVNCSRVLEIGFSQIYYDATQKVLLNTKLVDGDPSNGEYDGPEDLAGLGVCAPEGSTSLEYITEAAQDAGAESDPVIKPAGNHTGCLVKFQRGEVDVITGDDTVLAGLAAQDPYAVVPLPCDDPDLQPGETCQDPLNDEPYGIGANKADVDLIKFVNQVLQDMRDGAWDRAYNTWLKDALNGAEAEQPEPTGYRDE